MEFTHKTVAVVGTAGISAEKARFREGIGLDEINWHKLRHCRARAAIVALPLLRYRETSARTRVGLPEPFWIFKGGQISTAPVAGN